MSQLPEAEQQVLIVIAFLAKRRAPRPREDVTGWGPRYFGMFQVDWTGAVDRLLARGLLALNAGQLVLTPAGQPAADELCLQNPKYLYFYNEFYTRAATSPAHARFCERVYGKNLVQHGMADMEQVDWMVRTLGLGPHSRVLELGCGNGGVGEYISDNSGAHLTGVDGSEVGITQAVERTRAKADRLSFLVADMSSLRFPCGEFDTVISIDTVYYDNDMAGLIADMQAITGSGGQMGVFYSTWQEEEQPREALKSEHTLFYRAVDSLGLDCQCWVFTRQEVDHWTRKYETAVEMEAAFAAEGQQWLRERRLEEAASHIAHVRAGRVARYFYKVLL